MVKRSKGTLSKKTKRTTRKKKITVSEKVRKFSVGDKVVYNPVASTKGRPHLRYRNKHGRIVEKRGNGYVVEIKDGGKKKFLISDPIHLTPSG
jgi:large subunit ribosomal protein L21e